MSHTPEDLFALCEEKGLLLDLLTASYNNTYGFSHFPAAGNWWKKTGRCMSG